MEVATIAAHPKVFSRVLPYNAVILLDRSVSRWWGHDEAVAAWTKPLQGLGVLPYLLDIAIVVAQHYGFQGWFIDHEDEYPVDTDPKKSQTRLVSH